MKLALISLLQDFFSGKLKTKIVTRMRDKQKHIVDEFVIRTGRFWGITAETGARA